MAPCQFAVAIIARCQWWREEGTQLRAGQGKNRGIFEIREDSDARSGNVADIDRDVIPARCVTSES